jgi:hypothetical protein
MAQGYLFKAVFQSTVDKDQDCDLASGGIILLQFRYDGWCLTDDLRAALKIKIKRKPFQVGTTSGNQPKLRIKPGGKEYISTQHAVVQ